MVDWAAVMYDPIYDILGVEATIRPGVGGSTFVITALDKTSGITVGSGIDVQTIRPAAVIRMSELIENDVRRQDLDNGDITINGINWKIETTLPRPSPAGEADGELFLILIEAWNDR